MEKSLRTQGKRSEKEDQFRVQYPPRRSLDGEIEFQYWWEENERSNMKISQRQERHRSLGRECRTH